MYGTIRDIRGDHSKKVIFPVPLSPPVNPEPLPCLWHAACMLFYSHCNWVMWTPMNSVKNQRYVRLTGTKWRLARRDTLVACSLETSNMTIFINSFKVCEQHWATIWILGKKHYQTRSVRLHVIYCLSWMVFKHVWNYSLPLRSFGYINGIFCNRESSAQFGHYKDQCLAEGNPQNLPREEPGTALWSCEGVWLE